MISVLIECPSGVLRSNEGDPRPQDGTEPDEQRKGQRQDKEEKVKVHHPVVCWSRWRG